MNFNELQLKINPKNHPKHNCKGLFYRCRTNDFLNQKGEYISQFKMIPLKRMSCKGCEHCGFFNDDLKEFIANDTLPIVDRIVNGGLYTLKICNESHDWETGYIDDWDLCFNLIKEE